MDFVVGLPRSSHGHDIIWVIVDRLTKSAHFLAARARDSLEKLARLYLNEVLRLHDLPISIIQIEIPDSHPDFGLNCRKLLRQL